MNQSSQPVSALTEKPILFAERRPPGAHPDIAAGARPSPGAATSDRSTGAGNWFLSGRCIRSRCGWSRKTEHSRAPSALGAARECARRGNLSGWRWLTFWILCAAASCHAGSLGAVEIVNNPAPQPVFAGEGRKISVLWRNPGPEVADTDLHGRILQTSSDTAAPLGETPWKNLRVLPGQTVMETAVLAFPAVKARASFLIQWCDRTNRVIGTTPVLVYPTNLLDELRQLVNDGGKFPGVLDPHREVGPALKNAGIKFVDLEETTPDSFSGPLALVGPCRPEDPEWNGLAQRVGRLTRKGTAVVWFVAPPPAGDQIQPSFYVVSKKDTVVVVVEPGLVARLPEDPRSQLNLIYFCKLALQSKTLELPDLTQP